ncbi:hypothetical protein ACIQ57_00560 [Lysinibacillus xylanilyticus]|uniref:hypothetical protein n=1 Tax=Lysinibacillus xylanilyticus TaxID=582475 RepID=UPI0038115C0B
MKERTIKAKERPAKATDRTVKVKERIIRATERPAKAMDRTSKLKNGSIETSQLISLNQ